MATVKVQIRVDENLKKKATELFNQLGIDMSSAVNMFLNQAVLNNGIPFKVELPKKTEIIEEKISLEES